MSLPLPSPSDLSTTTNAALVVMLGFLMRHFKVNRDKGRERDANLSDNYKKTRLVMKKQTKVLEKLSTELEKLSVDSERRFVALEKRVDTLEGSKKNE